MGLIGLPFMPEYAIFCISLTVTGLIITVCRYPWWLTSSGKEEAAGRSLRRLGCPPSNVEFQISSIKSTLERIKRDTDGVTFLECFRTSNLHRTIISITPLSIQALCGIIFIIHPVFHLLRSTRRLLLGYQLSAVCWSDNPVHGW